MRFFCRNPTLWSVGVFGLHGFLLGLVIAVGVITVKFLMDDKIHSAEDIEKYVGLPTLGVMPRQATKAAAPKRGRKENDAE